MLFHPIRFVKLVVKSQPQRSYKKGSYIKGSYTKKRVYHLEMTFRMK